MEHGGSEQRAAVLQALWARLSNPDFRSAITPRTLARIIDLGLADGAPEVKVATLRLFQAIPVAFNAGGHDPLPEEAWLQLIRSKEQNVAWNAVYALNSIRRQRPWSAPLCRAVLDGIVDMAAGRRSSEQLGHYMSVLSRPDLRELSEADLLDLCAAVAESEYLAEKDRDNVMQQVINYFTRERKDDAQALTELAVAGWDRLRASRARAYWFERFQHSKMFPPRVILEAAGEEEARIRRRAYGLFYENHDQYEPEQLAAALTHLEEDLFSEDKHLQQQLLYTLYYLGVPAAVPHLRRLRKESEDEGVRGLALTALVRAIGKEALPDVREDLAGEEWVRAGSQLVSLLGVGAVPELVELARRLGDGARPVLNKNNHLWVRPEVAAAYVAQLPEELLSGVLLEKTAKTLSPDLRVKLVVDALQSDRRDMVVGGARVAAELHVEQAWPWLIPLLDHPDKSLRESAKAALASIRAYRELKASFSGAGPEGSAKVLADAIALTKDEDPIKRRGGALAIGALGDVAGIPVLLTLLDDEDEEVKRAALLALEKLGGKTEGE
jgi:HEAT repeat protein